MGPRVVSIATRKDAGATSLGGGRVSPAHDARMAARAAVSVGNLIGLSLGVSSPALRGGLRRLEGARVASNEGHVSIDQQLAWHPLVRWQGHMSAEAGSGTRQATPHRSH